MTTLRLSILGLLACVALGASAQQQDIAGTWAGKLALAPGQELAVHFVLARAADGSYSGVLTSPDNSEIKNVRVDSVTFAGDKLAMTVNALSGSYDGTLKDGAFTGSWKQEGNALPLELKRYATPVLSQADGDRLLGTLVGKLTIPGGAFTMVVRFANDAQGAFGGTLESPDQGGGTVALSDVAVGDGSLTFRAPTARGEYKGSFDGAKTSGTWTQVGQNFALELAKGEYQARVLDLGLSGPAMTALGGKWQGTLVVLRFESPAPGRTVGYLDIPVRGVTGMPITAATFADGKFTIRIAGIQAEYAGTLAGTTLTGEWSQAGTKNAVTLTKTP